MNEKQDETTKAYYCVECGKCTGICPVSRGQEHSPRRLVKDALEGQEREVVHSSQIWACLTCKLCGAVCPSSVDYIEFIKNARTKAYKVGLSGKCSQGGQLQTLSRLMAKTDTVQRRTDWTEGLDVAKSGDVLYFSGCLSYFDDVFDMLAPNTLDIARSTVRILNAAGVKPVVSNSERCCGHDLLWSGDFGNYLKLAETNMKTLAKLDPKTIVTSCAECYRTLKFDYGQLFNHRFKIMHISEFIAESLDRGDLKLVKQPMKVTYSDPCRLGRHMNVYEPPRKVIGQCAELVEMPRNRVSAQCCGVGVWMNCSALSKEMQVGRLKEALASGAEKLITACPKCQIHLKCAQADKDASSADYKAVNITDIASLVANSLEVGR
jgi:Fe-S oxidoreductase